MNQPVELLVRYFVNLWRRVPENVKRVVRYAFVILVFVVIAADYIPVAFPSTRDYWEQGLFSRKTLKSIPVGEITYADKLLNTPTINGYICILSRFENSVSERDARAEIVNSYLQGQHVSLSDKAIRFVFLPTDKKSVFQSRYTLADDLSFVRMNEQNAKKLHEKLPSNFEPVQCADLAVAAFIKTDEGIVFGKIKTVEPDVSLSKDENAPSVAKDDAHTPASP
jgi:hypothetical protein